MVIMLSSLTIRNIALIDSLEVVFGSKLNILSGETGAGKSIIIDSLNMLLGARFDKSLLRHGADEGLVEGIFCLNENERLSLIEQGLECGDELIINRRLFSDGRSEVRLDGRLSTASVLKNIASQLVNIYGQNEHQILLKTGSHLKIIDYYSQISIESLITKVAALHKEYKDTLNQIGRFSDAALNERNIEIFQFQLNEIDEAKLKEGEEDTLLSVRQKHLSFEKIVTALVTAKEALYESENRTAIETISLALSAIGRVANTGAEYEELYERLEGVKTELKDIIYTLGSFEEGEFSETEYDKIERRLDIISNLKRKYGGSIEAIRKFKSKTQAELDGLLNAAENLEKLRSRRDELLRNLVAECEKLSSLRKEWAKKFEELVTAELVELGMPKVIFKVEFGVAPPLEDAHKFVRADGYDSPEFYISPNAGEPLKPLIKTISGGELSRFMLAVKVITSDSDGASTLIFDEVDTGISGIIGQAVAKKLAKIALRHQVLCITHLPQIASMADTHFCIEKSEKNGRTKTDLIPLDKNGMIEEIARLSGAKNISTEAQSNAQQMKEWSNEFKLKVKI